jgi:phosphatidylinositol glycan class T
MAAPYASDGTFNIRITNAGDEQREAVYSEVWPWWVKGWMGEVSVAVESKGLKQRELSSAVLVEKYETAIS